MSRGSTSSPSTRPAEWAAPGTGTSTPERCRTRQSFVYQYSFDRDLYTQNTWTHRFIKGPEVLAYLNSVVDRFDLREHIHLETGMTEARWDETSGTWTVETDRGATYRARFLITGLGILSATNTPEIHGIEHFEGRVVHSGAWPEELDLTGKRVGVIGNGSTGNQIITATAPIAGHLISFQRSPQYSVPVGNREVTAEQLKADHDNFDANWEQVRNSSVAMGFKESTIECFSVSAEERERIFQNAWDEGGGFQFMFGTFCDIATDEAANEEAARFIRRKIAEIVKDPETARKLTPTDMYARLPLCDSGFYEAFNRPNVEPGQRQGEPHHPDDAEGHRHRGRHPARTRRARVRHRLRRGRRQLHAGRSARPRRETHQSSTGTTARRATSAWSTAVSPTCS